MYSHRFPAYNYAPYKCNASRLYVFLRSDWVFNVINRYQFGASNFSPLPDEIEDYVFKKTVQRWFFFLITPVFAYMQVYQILLMYL
jgi:hypothetical protein